MDAEYDAIIITETWLTEEFLSAQLFGNRYSVYRKDRNAEHFGKKRGGGVLIAVSNSFSSKRVLLNIITNIEQLWVEIRTNDGTICIGALYLPPDLAVNPDYLEQHIESVNEIVNNLGSHVYHLLFGDYNQANLTWKQARDGSLYPDPSASTFSRSSSILIDGMSFLNMTQVNPVKNHRNRTLDLIFANEIACRKCYIREADEPLVDADLYHPALVVSLQYSIAGSFVELVDDVQYDFRKADFEVLSRSIAEVDWMPLLSARDVNEAVSYLINTLSALFLLYVPPPGPKRKPPWSNRRLRMLKRERARALRHYSNTRNPFTKRQFIIASNRYRSYNRLLYSLHIQRTQTDLKRNPKRFWSFISSKRNELGLPLVMHNGPETANTPEGICCLFADHFIRVFKNKRVDAEQISKALQCVPEDVLEMHNIAFTEADVKAAVKKLKLSWKPGPDGIPSIVFKHCIEVLIAPLTYICNLSMAQHVFPSIWKDSVLFPVYKKGDRDNVTNYRGITSLCAGSKLLEILVNKLLLYESKQYISCDQHGFFPGRSTSSNLTEFTSLCIRHMESGFQIDTIYTDLKAAFDRVDHDLLLAKIKRLGAANGFVEWLRSYLVNRRVSVRLGNVQSEQFINPSGVPQGSNLGPLLFSLFFNDVCAVLPRGCRLLYADDLKIFRVVKSDEDCIVLQKLINRFANWCCSNELLISVNKCSVISFHRKKAPIMWNYNIQNEPLQRVQLIKDLGVYLDQTLSFRDHYSYIISKANKNLGFIFRVSSEFRDPYCLRALYFSLVRSILEYAAVVWSPYFVVWSSRIETIQSRFLRYALRSLPWTNPYELPPYEERCRLLDMDTLERRRKIERVIFIRKVLVGEMDCPNILNQININAASRSLRRTQFLRPDFRRTDYGQNEPIRIMCCLFNDVYHYNDFNTSSVSLRNQLIRSNVLR